MAMHKTISQVTNTKHFLGKEEFKVIKEKLSDQAFIQDWKKNGKPFIVRVPNIFEESMVEQSIKLLHADPCEIKNEVIENNGVTRRELIGGLFSTEEVGGIHISKIVKFDGRGLPCNKDELEQEFRLKQVTGKLKQLALAGLTKMSRVANWQSCEVPVTCFVLKYPLGVARPKQSGFPWHYDINSLTLTCVLNEPIDERGSFSGGELMFAERKKGHVVNPQIGIANETVQEFKYQPYSGLMFENLWSIHKVNDIVFNTESENIEGCRYLFSIFANPTPKQFNITQYQCEHQNLAAFLEEPHMSQRTNWFSCFS